MKFHHGMAVGLIFSATFGEPVFAQSSTSSNKLKADADAIAQKYHLGQVWLFVEKDGKVVANLGINGANAGEQEPVGSLSKSITGIAIALLIQQHKLSLDSTVGDVLGKKYAENNRAMNDNLKSVTIERLLTHTAGLQPSSFGQGINLVTLVSNLNAKSTAFDLFKAYNVDSSDGQRSYAYSNYGYLLLGLIVEAVSGENYESFCRRHIFGSVGVRPSTVGGRYTAITPYIGWVLSRSDIATVWQKVFNPSHPSILSRNTLESTLFAPLGQAIGSAADTRYVMGAQIKKSPDGSSYRLFHNGAIFGTGSGRFYNYIEDTNSDLIWVIATNPWPQDNDIRNIQADIRQTIESDIVK